MNKRISILTVCLLWLGACTGLGPPTPGTPTTFEDVCGKPNEGKRLSLEGYLNFPEHFTVSKGSDPTVMLLLRPSPGAGANPVGASVVLGNGPNRVAMPPKSFTPADLKLTTADGATVGYRDKVRVSGTMYYPSSIAHVDFKCGLDNSLVESAGK
jgi:hypothetical protein